MESTPIYVCGALIIPDGRITLTAALYGNKISSLSYMSLSVEAYAHKANKCNDFEQKVKNELNLQLNVADSLKLIKMSDTSVIRNTTTNTKREIKLFTYKLEDMFTFKIDSPNNKLLIFYSIDEILNKLDKHELKLGVCGKEMLNHLVLLKDLKVF